MGWDFGPNFVFFRRITSKSLRKNLYFGVDKIGLVYYNKYVNKR